LSDSAFGIIASSEFRFVELRIAPAWYGQISRRASCHDAADYQRRAVPPPSHPLVILERASLRINIGGPHWSVSQMVQTFAPFVVPSAIG
jgi:hypothetical protein